MSACEAIRVFGPATVANVSCGFDILGFAVDEPGDTLSIERTTDNTITFECTGPSAIKIPESLADNAATAPLLKMREAVGDERGMRVSLVKDMPIGSGMGSSAASAAAAVVAYNEILGRPFTRQELVTFALEGERVACGAAHADNVAPSILGGIVLIRDSDPLDIIQLPVPERLQCVIVHPNIRLDTKDARDILKKQVSLEQATKQWGNTAAFVAALFRDDLALLSRSMRDLVVEPERAAILPGFHDAVSATRAAGALGVGISGSGPSLFALCESPAACKDIAEAFEAVFEKLDIDSRTYSGSINTTGVRILDK